MSGVVMFCAPDGFTTRVGFFIRPAAATVKRRKKTAKTILGRYYTPLNTMFSVNLLFTEKIDDSSIRSFSCSLKPRVYTTNNVMSWREEKL